MRRLSVPTAIAAVLVVLASLLVSVTGASAAAPKFSDVPPKSLFYGDITWLAANNITTGNANGTFSPTGTVSREAMAAFLYRFAHPGETATACTSPPFADVPTDNPFCADIAQLKADGITTGNADGTYGPLAAVNRQSMAAFMYRIVNDGGAAPACTSKPFTDVKTSNPFCGDIKWLVGRGVTDGYSDGGYHPNAVVVREAMAAFLHRLNTGVPGLSAPPPIASDAHYIRTTNPSTLESAGAADAAADKAAGGTHLHLLDIGAQSTHTPLSAQQPGVVLSGTTIRHTYPVLVTSLESYLHGYQSVSGVKAVVAVGTNSDGCFSGCAPSADYSAASKGSDWWSKVIAPLRSYSAKTAPNTAVVGANDIEAGFAATEAQAAQWEKSFEAGATKANVAGLQLVFNGSADDCPSSFDSPGRTCTGASTGPRWTEAQYAALASGPHIQALPQIYDSAMSIRWANIDSTVDGAMTFLGTLTEHAADRSTSQLPNRGWIGLWNALTASQAAPLSAAKLPNSVDLDILD